MKGPSSTNAWHTPRFSLTLEQLTPADQGGKFAEVALSRAEAVHKATHEHFTSGRVGFYDWPQRFGGDEFTAVESIARYLRDNATGVLCLGIGGSALGPIAAEEALRTPEDAEKFPIHWVTNVDPTAIAKAERFAKGGKRALVVISKSGGTTETLSALFRLLPFVDERMVVAVTDPESGYLRKLAEERGWATLPVPPNVGGRYSVLTAVGLLPMQLAGLSIRGVMEGARETRDFLAAAKPEDNAALRFAAATWFADSQLHRPIQYLLAYRSSLERFADWYVQLWAESLGQKRRSDRVSVGPTPVPGVGTADQHSVLQLLREGPQNKIVGFLSVNDREATDKVPEPPFNADAVRYLIGQRFSDLVTHSSRAVEKSLGLGGTPTYRVELPKLDEAAIGALFFFYETACAYAGEFYDVAAFDQPGVEETKRLWRQALERNARDH